MTIPSQSFADKFKVAALYHFARFDRFADVQAPLTEVCEKNGIVGTLLLASEGINGTIAGSREGIDTVLDFIRGQPEFAALEHKESFADELPFYRLKVRLKNTERFAQITCVPTFADSQIPTKPSNWT